MRRLFFALTLILLLYLPNALAIEQVTLTNDNRMLPVAQLFHQLEPSQAQALSLGSTTPQLQSINANNTWYQLTLVNRSSLAKVFILTRPQNLIADSSLLLSRASQSFQMLTPQPLTWPFNGSAYQLELAPGEQVHLYTQEIDQVPTQLWAQTWWQQYQQQQSLIGAFSWGGLISLLLIQACLFLFVPILPRSLFMLQLLATVLVLYRTGAETYIDVLKYLDLSWPLLIALASLLLFTTLKSLLIQDITKPFAISFYLLAAASLLLTSWYMLAPTSQSQLYVIGSLLLIILHQAAMLLSSIKQGYQQGHLAILGVYISFSILGVSLLQVTKITELSYLYFSASAMSLLGVLFSLSLLTSRAKSSIKLEAMTSKQLKHKNTQAKSHDGLENSDIAKKLSELEVDHKLLQQKNAIDFLTGIKNRQFFDEKYHKELAISAREKKPLGLILVDLDFFKKVNDNYGHQVGDEVLKEVAKRLYFSLKRPADAVCRYGGEEFAIILPNTPLQGALYIAQTINAAVKTKPILTSAGPINITLSQGVTAKVIQLSDQESKLLNDADKALYKAKSNGRDRIEVASDKPFLVKSSNS